jgi:hypothetical protein
MLFLWTECKHEQQPSTKTDIPFDGLRRHQFVYVLDEKGYDFDAD